MFQPVSVPFHVTFFYEEINLERKISLISFQTGRLMCISMESNEKDRCIMKDYRDAFNGITEDLSKQRHAKQKLEGYRSLCLKVGKWIADNIVSVCALVVAIISLIRTF